MKTAATLFEIEDPVTNRPWQRVAPVTVEASEDDVTGVAGIALFGDPCILRFSRAAAELANRGATSNCSAVS